MSEEELEKALDEIFKENTQTIRENMKSLTRCYNNALEELIKQDKVIKKLKYKLEGKDCWIDTLEHNEDVIEEALNKQDKVIDLMAREIAKIGKNIEIINLYNNVSPDKPIYDLVKEHFYKKVEEEK